MVEGLYEAAERRKCPKNRVGVFQKIGKDGRKFTENILKSLVRLLKNMGRVFDPPQTITNTHATEALVDDPLGNARQSEQSQH